MSRPHLTAILSVDAAGCVLGGAALLVVAGPAATAAGLARVWPVVLLGSVLVAYGVDNGLVARRPGRGGVAALAAVDVLFGVGAAVLAVLDPTGARASVRTGLLVVAVLSATMGVLKLAGRRTLPTTARREAVAA